MADPINEAPQPGTPEYDAAMAAKFEAGTGNDPAPTDPPADPPADERPDWLPEKFKTVEDFVKSHSELEKKLGEQGSKKDDGEVDPNAPPNTEEAARKTVDEAGLNFDELAADYETNGGKLSEEAYTKLEEAGIPRDIVDGYIAGQVAVVENLRNTAFGVAGGEQNYMSMVEWAKTNMKPSEIEAFNSVVGGNDPAQIAFAVTGLKARYEAVNGSDPKLVGGGNNGSAVGDTFASWAQVTEAMRDPKYAKDPAYRAEVEAKLGRSNPV